jgi:thymidylate synthase
MWIKADTLDDILGEVFRRLLKSTSRVRATRGEFTEIIGVTLQLTDPRARLSRSEAKGKVFSALGELFWYLSQATELSFIEYYIPGVYEKESEDGSTVRSGYGERLFSHNGVNQLKTVIKILTERPSSRRAVIQLFDAADLARPYKSVPCTCSLQFLLRDGRLNLLTSMRSNDAYLGLPHDVFTFTMLQEIVARTIGCELGEYKHFVGSLHLYDEHRDYADIYISEGWQSIIQMPPMPNGDPWSAISVVQDVEQRLRTRQDELTDLGSLNEYWKDICRLLGAYRASKDGNIEKLRALRQELNSETYRVFLNARLDWLTGKSGREKAQLETGAKGER